MAKTNTKKQIHYKRAQITGSDESLQTLISKALNIKDETDKAAGRQYWLNESEFQLVNHHKTNQGAYVGEFVYTEMDKSQSLINQDPSLTYYPIRSVTPASLTQDDSATAPTKNSKGTTKEDFVESFLYFAIHGDDVALMQSRGLHSRDFEKYLKWLLIERTNLLDEDALILLNDQVPSATCEKIKTAPVKSILLGTPIETKTRESNVAGESVLEFLPEGAGFELLKSILGKTYFDSRSLSDSLDASNLSLQLKLTYKRKTDENGQSLLNEMSTAFRHMHDDDTEVLLSNGVKLKSGDLKISHTINVKFEDGKLDKNDLYSTMRDWLVETFVE